MRLEKTVLIIGMILCSTAFSWAHQTLDYTLPIRNLIWATMMLVLFFLLVQRMILNISTLDFSSLRRAIFPLLLLYVVTVFYSTIFAANVGEALYWSTKTALWMLTIIFMVLVLRDESALLKALILVTLLLGAYGIYQYFTLSMERRIGTMANMNQNSSSFFLLGGLALYSFIKYRRWRIPAALAILISLFIIFTLRTRSVWLGLGVFLFILALRKRKLILPIVAGVLIVSGVVYQVRGGSTVFNTGSIKQRSQIWKQTLNMIADHPMGVGAGNWKIAINSYSAGMTPIMRNMTYTRTFFARPHNDFLWVLSETGFAGFILYLLIVALSLYYCYPNKILFSLLVGYLTISFFTFPMERIFHSLIHALFIALGVLTNHRPSKWRPSLGQLVIGTTLTFGILAFACVDFTARFTASARSVRVLKAAMGKNWPAIITETQRISSLASVDITGTPMSYYRGVGFIRLNLLPQATRAFEEARIQNPHHLFVLMSLASVYYHQQKIDKALECYSYVNFLYPDYPEAHKQVVAIRNEKWQSPK